MDNAEHLRLHDHRVDQLLEKLEIPGLLRDKSEEEIRSQFTASGFNESTGDDVLTHVSVVRTPENAVVEVRMGDRSVYSMRRIVENADTPTDEEMKILRQAVNQIGESGYRVPYGKLDLTLPKGLTFRVRSKLQTVLERLTKK